MRLHEIRNIGFHEKEGFPGSSAGKEATCNAGDPGLIPGSGIFNGEGIGYPLQYSWASLVAQLVKNPSPGERKGYLLQYSGMENSMNYPWGHKESDMTERLK